MKNLLLLEDHPATVQWMQEIASAAFETVCITHADCLEQARTMLQQNRYHIALLDIHLPDGNGIDLIATIKTRLPDCIIIMTTIFDDDQHLFDALRAGAQGYLLKEQPRDDLIKRLQGLYRGEPPLSPGIARRMLAYFQPVATTPQVGLSPRELETLTLIAKGYSVKQLARLLEISDHTAAGYVKSVYRKLNVSSRAEATLEAAKWGLVKA